MPIGTYPANVKQYEEQIHGRMVEVSMQFADAFNAASRGCIALGTEGHRGNYAMESFWKETAGLIQHRDPGDVTTALTPVSITQGEVARVKVNKTIYTSMTEDAFYKKQSTPAEFGRVVGEQQAVAQQVDRINRALAVLVGTIGAGNLVGPGGFGVGATILDKSAAATPTILHEYLNDLFAFFGDHSSVLTTLVMHSKVWHNLIGSAIIANAFETQAFAISNGTTASLGRSVIVIDSPSLVIAGPKYRTIALQSGACITDASEPSRVAVERKTGKHNILLDTQVEWADTLGARGYTYGMATANPTDANLADPTKWVKAASSVKSSAGVILVTL